MSKARDIADSTTTLDVDGGTIKLDGNYPVGTNNVALGNDAMLRIESGADSNTVVGHSALSYLTTGDQNTAVGRGSLNSVTTGSYNSAFGFGALNQTTGQYNTAVGVGSLQLNTTASNNTAVGYQAGYSNTTGQYNTFVGQVAGVGNTTGQYNTLIGRGAGGSISTGSKNTVLGGYDGNQGGLDIRTSSNNIVLSDGDGNPQTWIQGNGSTNHYGHASSLGDYIATWNMRGTNTDGLQAFYNGVTPNNASRYFFRGKDATAKRVIIYSNGNIVNANNSYGSISDFKLKENIVDASSQWDDIKALTVRKYSMKADSLDAPNMLGVIAQEVEAAGMGGLIFESPDTDADNNDLGTVTKQVNYSILYMKAVKALQEAMTRIETLETKVTALEGA